MSAGNLFVVSVYLVDKAYGGPEEGGWWYTYGEPQEGPWLRFLRTFTSAEAALKYRDRLDRSLDHFINRHRPSISSVLSQGAYRVMVTEGLPRPFPEEIPHYS